MGVNRAWVETDSELVEHWFNGRGTPPRSLYNIWREIIELDEYLDLKISHVCHETNIVTDSLVRSSVSDCSQFVTCTRDLPKVAISCIVLYSSGIPTFRFH